MGTESEVSSVNLVTDGQREESRLLAVRLVGAAIGASSVGLATGGHSEQSSSASLATGGRSDRILVC